MSIGKRRRQVNGCKVSRHRGPSILRRPDNFSLFPSAKHATHTPRMLADPSSQSSGLVEVAHESKRMKRPYHHHHQLQSPVVRELAEPAITDHATVDHLLTRSIGLSLQDEGFELADAVALDGFRNALEECMSCRLFSRFGWD